MVIIRKLDKKENKAGLVKKQMIIKQAVILYSRIKVAYMYIMDDMLISVGEQLEFSHTHIKDS